MSGLIDEFNRLHTAAYASAVTWWKGHASDSLPLLKRLTSEIGLKGSPAACVRALRPMLLREVSLQLAEPIIGIVNDQALTLAARDRAAAAIGADVARRVLTEPDTKGKGN